MKLLLVNCNPDLIKAVLKGDHALGEALNADIPNPWSEFGLGVFEYVQTELTKDPDSAIWWFYLAILEEENTRTLVGNCGFKGRPDDNGIVELGYEVAESFRGRGLATQMTEMLLHKAFQHPEVSKVIAHTLAERNASCRVLEKCKFSYTKEIEDEEDGTIMRWERSRLD